MRLLLVLLISIFVFLPMALVQFIVVHTPFSCGTSLPILFHRIILWMLRVKIVIRGDVSLHKPTLFVSNHWSWLDIPVLGAVLKAHFVAKSEVSGWPIFGFLAKLQRTIFVARHKRQDAQNQANEIADAFGKNKNVILFAEGTSNDGNRILPFKSSLLSSAYSLKDAEVYVQPLTIIYHKINGLPCTRMERPYIAWYGLMEMVSHLKEFASLGYVEVVLEFAPVITNKAIPSRKELTKYLETTVRKSYIDTLTSSDVN